MAGTAQFYVLSDTLVITCTDCTYDFTCDNKPSPNNSQEDSQKAHTYQLIPVPFQLFLKLKTAFLLIHQP